MEIKENCEEQSKTCNYTDFIMTVVKMNMKNDSMDHSRVKISVPEVI